MKKPQKTQNQKKKKSQPKKLLHILVLVGEKCRSLISLVKLSGLIERCILGKSNFPERILPLAGKAAMK